MLVVPEVIANNLYENAKRAEEARAQEPDQEVHDKRRHTLEPKWLRNFRSEPAPTSIPANPLNGFAGMLVGAGSDARLEGRLG